MMKTQIPDRELINLSAYLDGQLSPSQARHLAALLAQEPELQAALNDLRKTRSMLRAAPRLRSPRNFTLTGAMAGQPAKAESRFVPAYRLVSAIASLLFVLVVVGDLFGAGFSGMPSAPEQAMPAMMEDQQPSVAMEAPAAAATVVVEDGEMETFALEMEPTQVVELEASTAEEEREEESEPPSEPVAEALAMAEPDSTPTQEAPTPAEPAVNAKEIPAEDDVQVLGEAAQEPPGEEGLATVLEKGSEQADEGVPIEDQLAGVAERAMGEEAPREPASEPDLWRKLEGWGWTPLRFAELGLALVALSFGALAWVNRRRG